MEKHGYQPVSCDYHDQLEAASMHRNEVELEFEGAGGRQKERGIIADVFSRDGEEFVKLQAPAGEIEVRLDRIAGLRELS